MPPVPRRPRFTVCTFEATAIIWTPRSRTSTRTRSGRHAAPCTTGAATCCTAPSSPTHWIPSTTTCKAISPRLWWLSSTATSDPSQEPPRTENTGQAPCPAGRREDLPRVPALPHSRQPSRRLARRPGGRGCRSPGAFLGDAWRGHRRADDAVGQGARPIVDSGPRERTEPGRRTAASRHGRRLGRCENPPRPARRFPQRRQRRAHLLRTGNAQDIDRPEDLLAKIEHALAGDLRALWPPPHRAKAGHADVARLWHEKLGSDDVSQAAEHWHDEISWRGWNVELPGGGSAIGRSAVEDLHRRAHAAPLDFRADAREYIEQGDRVLVLGDAHGAGPNGGFAAPTCRSGISRPAKRYESKR